MKLENLRNVLIRLEESIIFALIERAQFRVNASIYDPAAMPQFNGLSFLNFFLYETEILHAKVRRYTSPDEHSFCDPAILPAPILPQLEYPVTLKANTINVNKKIHDYYVHSIIPAICKAGDDQNYGSAATADITCLQLLSKRIHYGKFVAESKFRSEPHLFTHAIIQRDINVLMELITKPVVEEQVIQRVHLKAATYGGEPINTPSTSPALPPQRALAASNSLNTLSLNDTNSSTTTTSTLYTGGVDVMSGSGANSHIGKYKISPDIIANIYLQIIALNKEVQIEYLLQRLDP